MNNAIIFDGVSERIVRVTFFCLLELKSNNFHSIKYFLCCQFCILKVCKYTNVTYFSTFRTTFSIYLQHTKQPYILARIFIVYCVTYITLSDYLKHFELHITLYSFYIYRRYTKLHFIQMIGMDFNTAFQVESAQVLLAFGVIMVYFGTYITYCLLVI